MVDFDGSRSIWLSGPHPDFHSDRVTRKHQYLQQRSAPTQTVTLFKERKKGKWKEGSMETTLVLLLRQEKGTNEEGETKAEGQWAAPSKDKAELTC